ncbi:MAG TPA: histidine phosphatase family protein, partial [Desulfobacterales bacterium]|nr:histidine phosphatase family protein [Desulfobacterales bacterium]
MSKIFLIRHGQASFLEDDYDNLSNKGIEQSEALGTYFLNNEIHFDKIYIGNLKRHRQTFEAYSKAFIGGNIEIAEPVFLEELNEHMALDAFKLAYDDFILTNENANALFEEIKHKPHLQQSNYIQIFSLFFSEFVLGKYPLNGHAVQSWSDFRIQAKKGIATILDNTNSGETVGVFTSGGTKSSIIGDSLDLADQKISELNMAIRNTSFSQLYFSRSKLNILSINEIPHLIK